MSDTLNMICAQKQRRVNERKEKQSYEDIKADCNAYIAQHGAARSFYGALKEVVKEQRPALIAEIKKASPSAGLIRDPFLPQSIAQSYAKGGASCLSILTEEDWFQGDDAYLKQVRDTVSLPILRKDFVVDPYQIYESRLIGADCILLIVAALSDDQLLDYHACALGIGLDVLVEVHNEDELRRALLIPDLKLLGVNNRNLKTLVVDIQTSHDLLSLIPDDVLKVSESGISQRDDLHKLYQAGYSAFLIGEHFMRQEDIEEAVCSLLSPV